MARKSKEEKQAEMVVEHLCRVAEGFDLNLAEVLEVAYSDVEVEAYDVSSLGLSIAEHQAEVEAAAKEEAKWEKAARAVEALGLDPKESLGNPPDPQVATSANWVAIVDRARVE